LIAAQKFAKKQKLKNHKTVVEFYYKNKIFVVKKVYQGNIVPDLSCELELIGKL
jgi:hypothetical protein